MSMEMNLVSDQIGEWKTVHTWSPGNPNLYEVEFTLLKNSVETDHIISYFGMRKVSIMNGKVLLNNSRESFNVCCLTKAIGRIPILHRRPPKH